MFNRALPAAASREEQDQSEEQSGGFACVPPEVIGVPFPTAAYDQNLFYKAVGYLLGLAMTMVSRQARLISGSSLVLDTPPLLSWLPRPCLHNVLFHILRWEHISVPTAVRTP